MLLESLKKAKNVVFIVAIFRGEYSVAHIAINVSPKDCDLFYYNSFQPMPRMGLGMAHKVNFAKGVLKEVKSYQTYIS